MNNELKCPNCGTVFQIDEQDYESIVKQIRDKEFEKEITIREAQFRNDKEQALKLAEAKAEKDLADELNKKELEIASLKNELKLKETETENRLEKKYGEELNRKVVEITELKNEIKLKDTEKELALKDIVNEKDKEIDSLNTRLESNKNEFLVKEQSLKDKYEEKIKDKDEQIAYYKDFKDETADVYGTCRREIGRRVNNFLLIGTISGNCLFVVLANLFLIAKRHLSFLLLSVL